jgi:hypothetical protein
MGDRIASVASPADESSIAEREPKPPEGPAQRLQRTISAALSTFALITALASPASAHPGIGIVRDSRGNIFYTDLRHVWMVAPDGTRSVAVRDVHTHELCLDADDNLYGEHLRYEGDATRIWRHRVWKRSPDGVISDVIPEREGFLTGYSFVRDRAGNMYWAERERVTLIRNRTPDGGIQNLATIPSRDVGWLHAGPDGTLYVSDNDDIVRIDPEGNVQTLARDLAVRSPDRPRVGQRLDIMGLWLDQEGSLFAAVPILRQVKKIDPAGQVSVVLKADPPWRPVGGLAEPDGDLWILESSDSNAVRVRRVRPDGTSGAD